MSWFLDERVFWNNLPQPFKRWTFPVFAVRVPFPFFLFSMSPRPLIPCYPWISFWIFNTTIPARDMPISVIPHFSEVEWGKKADYILYFYFETTCPLIVFTSSPSFSKAVLIPLPLSEIDSFLDLHPIPPKQYYLSFILCPQFLIQFLVFSCPSPFVFSCEMRVERPDFNTGEEDYQ